MIGATLLLVGSLLGIRLASLTPLPMSVPNLVRGERAVSIDNLPPNSRAYNGSIVQAGTLYVMAYRYDTRLGTRMAQTQIAVTRLDAELRPIGPISLLETRLGAGTFRFTAEDPRLFVFRGELYVTYNSTETNEIGGYRQVYLAHIEQVPQEDGEVNFVISGARQLTLLRVGGTGWMEKSWVPAVANDHLYMLHEHNPPEAYRVPDDAFPLASNMQLLALSPVRAPFSLEESRFWPFGPLQEGRPAELVSAPGQQPFFHRSAGCAAEQASELTFSQRTAPRIGHNQWPFGAIRGGTPTFSLPDGRLGAFFHSGAYFDSGFGYNKHYFMGFYVLSPKPPFAIEQIFPLPILPPSYYGVLNSRKIIFPAGVIERDDVYQVSFGQNDASTWICDVDKRTLFSLLTSPDAS